VLCLYLYLLLFIILNLNLLTDGRNKHDDETREHWNAVSDSVKKNKQSTTKSESSYSNYTEN